MKTKIVTSQPWGLYHRKGSRVLCADGKIRSLAYLAQTADTFFSVPAAIRYKGKYIHGYVSRTEQKFIKGEKETGFLAADTFHPHTGQEAPYWPTWPDLANYRTAQGSDSAKWKADCNAADRQLNALIEGANK